ncbi:MAG: lipoate--protein ligase family protein [Armatimonadetes bacterium]|nr:lipoate--protein ligase family protein [Armatimonadota bacterium]
MPSSSPSNPGARLILTPPLPGALNMALDEVLLEGATRTGPALRLYAWSSPALSLGYGQRSDEVDFTGCREHGVDVTRRLTGGRAVLHADELTYSVVVPQELVGGLRGITESYRILSGGLIRALAELGLTAVCQPRRADARAARDPACFATALGGDLSVDGRKLIGSAQCHRFGGILQHGSLPIRLDAPLLAACLRRPPAAEVSWTCLAELGVEPDTARFAGALAAGFAPVFGAAPEPAEPTPDEWAAATALAQSKYAADEWVRRL